jgi:hypothetical protein
MKCRVQSAECRMKSAACSVRTAPSFLLSSLCTLHSALCTFALIIICSLATTPAFADPTQEDVFRSISDNVDGTVDGRKVLAVLAAAVAVVIILVVFSKRQKRQTLPKPLNHTGKLLRELTKTAGLKPGQARQLKEMLEELNAAGTEVESPVTLMLCPSLMKKSGTAAR